MNRPGQQMGRRRGNDLVGLEKGRVRRGRARRSLPDLMVELLEDRCVLSTVSISSGALNYSAALSSASALTISVFSTDPSDVLLSDPDQAITLGSGTSGWVFFGSDNEVVGPMSSFSSVGVTGATTAGQGLTVDFSNGDPLPAAGLTFTPTPATGNASNALTLTPGTGTLSFLSETYSPTGAGAGTITYSDAAHSDVPISFSSLSPVTDTVPSSTFSFTAPAGATTVDLVAGPTVGSTATTSITDGGTGKFESISFANKTAATVTVDNSGATTTLFGNPAAGLTTLSIDSGAGNDNVFVEGTPAGTTTHVDTGSGSGSTTYIGSSTLLLSPIVGNVAVQSTGGSNALVLYDDGETAAETYTIAGSKVTATSFLASVDFSGGGIASLSLYTSGGGTVNLDGLSQSGVATYNVTGGIPSTANTLNVTSGVATLDYTTTPGTLAFGSGQPTITYTDVPTVNVTKPATAPVGTGVATVKATAGQLLNNIAVAAFTQSDLANKSTGFVASINWGDGTTSEGTIAPVGTGSYQVTGTHTYSAGGSYPISVTLTDEGTSGSATVGSTTINVTSNGPVSSSPSPITSTADVSPTLLPNSIEDFTGLAISVKQDVSTTQDVATFKSTDTTAVPSDFTATINWGDGTSTAGTITEDASDVFHVSGTHDYTKAGSFTPIVTIKDINGTLYATGSFYQTNLVSSVFGQAAAIDSNLINPWGMSSSSTSPIWISDQASGVTTVYNPNASPITTLLTVTVPPSGTPSGPTGQVFNNDPTTTDFVVPGSSPAAPAKFLFATLAGTIDAWESGSTAVIAVPVVTGAAFTGLAQASVTSGTTTTYYLYAADFTGTTGANGIDVFDPTFAGVTGTGKTFDPATAFVDPNAVSGFDPYNIALLGGNLYVGYAKPNGTVTSPGGYVDEYSTAGAFIKRIYTDTSGTNLTGPWGMAIAPSGFGSFGGDLLVGNFGDSSGTAPNGTIVAINLSTDALDGTIDGADGSPIINAGQWGLLFGNGGSGGNTGTLYISAGIQGQTQGLFASISQAGGASASVAAASLTATGTTIHGVEGSFLYGQGTTPPPTGPTIAIGPVATFMDTGTPGAASSYSATIDWGDGTTSAAVSITAQGTADGTVYSVFGDHTYARPGTYAINTTITNTANGAVAIASGQAVIADAALTPSAAQPTVSTTEDKVFSGPVGSFTDGDPRAPTTDYTYVTIDWGDGTPMTFGTISQPGGAGTAFIVIGTHTYADSGVNGGIGTYPLIINVHDIYGMSTTITNTANVADVPLTIAGNLNPASDSGASNADDITDIVQPNFQGTTSEPGATIKLYTTPEGSTTPILIGQGVSDASDAWSITSTQALADGGYAITAVATDASGHTISGTTTIVPDLVIDTVGPKATSVSFDRLDGQIVVTFQDYGGPTAAGVGLNLSSIADAKNYQFVTVHHPRVGRFRINTITVSPGTTTGTQTATLSINNGHYIRGGWYFFTAYSASPGDTSGVRDIAGNALDGEFYGYFPSGNNVNGGNFVAQLTAIHHKIYPPSTVVGRATPVNPPGTRQGTVIDPRTFNPSKLPRSHSSPGLTRAARREAKAAHDVRGHARLARAPIRLVHHAGPALAVAARRAVTPLIATPATAASPGQVTAMGALGALDQSLDQVGTTRDKHRKS